ncbi:hypothetical protein LTR95_000086 [Oleoguttula sp. CCFEE 5521]
MSQQPTGGGYHVNNLNAADHAQVHVGDVHNHHEATDSELRDKIVRWLDAPSSASSHETARSRFTPGTGRWLLDSSVYRDWHSGKSPVVWITGKSGCCKTVLCSIIIDNVYKRTEGRDDSSFAYFYFAFSDDKRQSYQALLLSLVSQLLECQKAAEVDIPMGLQSAYEKRYRSTEVLEGALLSLLQRRTTTYIVIDALDECPEDDDARSRLLQGFRTIVDEGAGLRLLCTSRREPDIAENMQHKTVFEISVEDGAVNHDVTIYIADQIARSAKLAKLDAMVGGDIQRVLTKKAGGMFRWVTCQLEQIKRIGVGKESSIRQALHDLPRTLDETYERILSNFHGHFAEDVKRALEWLAFSRRPLQCDEFIETCITRTEAEPYVNVADREVYSDMVDLLSSLVQVSDDPYCAKDNATTLRRRGLSRLTNGWVTLAHFSVKEYLLSESIKGGKVAGFALTPALAYHNLAQNCVAYLLHAFPSEGLRTSDCFPLFRYARDFWSDYQREAEILMLGGLDTGLQISGLQIKMLQNAVLRKTWFSPEPYSWKPSPGVTALHIACGRGLLNTTAILCRLEPENINVTDDKHGSALIMACREGNRGIVAILLEAGATVDLTASHTSPLIAAVKGACSDIVKDLLAAGATVDLTVFGISPLIAAVEGGRSDIVRDLLRAGATVDLTASRTSPLIAAVKGAC